MKPIIKVENLSKQYRLGQVGTASIKDDWKRFWYRIRGKEDPFATLGEANDRSTRGSSNYVWALRDIDFEVKPGEVLGIIGRNGAGKSTLLKILSRVTEPTTGRVTMHGRVASLLEVGTGMHPDLTGRENVYLNGAILGMTKKEINRKFDEILDFAGVERYIDTPVKRYSSGMHVRLGFAVAAHLEPEILIVDEVLAVGDAEFQKKCLGKMKEASEQEGRTVLFVSHNISAIQRLCTSCLLLNNGTIELDAPTKDVVARYMLQNAGDRFYQTTNDNKDQTHILRAWCEGSDGDSKSELAIGEPFLIRVNIQLSAGFDSFICAAGIMDINGTPVHTTWSLPTKVVAGNYQATFEQSNFMLGVGRYSIVLGLSNKSDVIQYLEPAFSFEIVEIIKQVDPSVKVVHNHAGIILNPMKSSLIKT